MRILAYDKSKNFEQKPSMYTILHSLFAFDLLEILGKYEEIYQTKLI